MVNNAPRKRRVGVMSARRPIPQPRSVEPEPPSSDEGTTTTSEASSWGTDPWKDTPMSSRPNRARLMVMAQPVKFWPDGREPPFTGEKVAKRTFVTDGKGKPSKEITGNISEIDRLRDAQCSKQIFHPRTGDILLYHDYSDYEDSESDFDDEHFQILDGVHVNSGRATTLMSGSGTTPASDDDEVEVYDGVVTTSSKKTSQFHRTEYILLDQHYSQDTLAHLETARHWIGRGKKFPPNALSTPYDLQQLCTAVLTVPTRMLAQLLPPEDISVEDLIDLPIPGISAWLYEGAITFENGLPTSEVSPTWELPRLADVEMLRDNFGQALLDGKRSLVDPRFKDQLLPLWTIEFWWQLHRVHTNQLLPLWTIEFWWQLHRVHTSKKQWKGARCWLQDRITANKNVQMFREAEMQLCKLPTNKLLCGPGAHSGRRTDSLIHFLSNTQWLSEPLIDVMVANLVARLDAKQHDFIIASTNFIDAILCAKEISYHEKPHSQLREFEETAKKRRYLCAPAHRRLTSHFIAFEIDFHARTFRYGDSLDQKQRTDPQYITTRLQWWFEKRFNGKFTDLGPTLPAGRQKDYCSCGLFAINTIEHRVFGYPLDVPNPDFERSRWFALTAKDQVPHPKGPGFPVVRPSSEMDVLLSGQDETKQDTTE
ncbi:hypothetical protein BDR03DRAFT_1017515 [Suillus americanus]|nr:hypothetical protein BDR03DRAFT_1017515 [Suillus americanus]